MFAFYFQLIWVLIGKFEYSIIFTQKAFTSTQTGEAFHIDPNELDPVYEKYNFKNFIHTDTVLPIFESQDEILETINANPVVVIQGDTGCGKSTQVNIIGACEFDWIWIRLNRLIFMWFLSFRL